MEHNHHHSTYNGCLLHPERDHHRKGFCDHDDLPFPHHHHVHYLTEIPVHDNSNSTVRGLDEKHPDNHRLHYEYIMKDLSKLHEEIRELLIRFDTNPSAYLKDDYLHLIRCILDLIKFLQMSSELVVEESDIEEVMTYHIPYWKIYKIVWDNNTTVRTAAWEDNLLVWYSGKHYTEIPLEDITTLFEEEWTA